MFRVLAALSLVAVASACSDAPVVAKPVPLSAEAYTLSVDARQALERTLARLFGPPDAPRFAVLPGWSEAGFDPNAPAPTGIDDDLAKAVANDARTRFFDALLAVERGKEPEVGSIPASLAERIASSGDARAAIETWQPSLAEAARTYQSQCVTCHGLAGGGDGPSAAKLDPRPRDFREGAFRFHPGAPESAPSQGDLVRTMRRGIPGSGMPMFGGLGASTQSGLADYVRFLALRGAVERAFVARARDGSVPTDAEMDEVYAEAWARWAILPGHEDPREVEGDPVPTTSEESQEG
ncbi:MAG: cytochrome c [Planctomycetota bacterium]